jgi:multidrug efflux system membrane fusion protein
MRILSAILLCALSTMGAACSKSSGASAAGPPPPEVSVAAVIAKPVRLWDEFTGRVVAVKTVDVRARVSGYVQRVAFREGQEVKEGDLLFTIDDRRYRNQLGSAQAELERARSTAQLTQLQNARSERLLAVQAISAEEGDIRKAASAQGVAAVHAAEAAVATAKLDIGFAEVRSPIAGRAGRAALTPGNLVQADTTLLTTVVSQDPVYVYFDVDEQAFLRYGARTRGDEHGKSVRVGLASEAGYPHEGEVDFIDNQVTAGTGSIHMRAVLKNPDRIFVSGLFARVQLAGARDVDAILIDDKAVLTDQDRKYVYVLGAENKAQRKDIVAGRAVGGLRVVDSGLTATDQIVVDGVQKIFMPGMRVKPQVVVMGAR